MITSVYRRVTASLLLIGSLSGCYVDKVEVDGEEYPVPADGKVEVRDSPVSYSGQSRHLVVDGRYLLSGARIGVECEITGGGRLAIGQVQIAQDGTSRFPGPAPADCVLADTLGAYQLERIVLVARDMDSGLYIPLVSRKTMECVLAGTGSFGDSIRDCAPELSSIVGAESTGHIWKMSESVQPVHKLTLEWRVARSVHQSLDSKPLVGTMFYDFPFLDAYLEPLSGLDCTRDIAFLQKDSTNLMIINGLSPFDFGETTYQRVPWEAFLQDCNGQACSYEQLRQRMGDSSSCPDDPHDIETAGEWLCHMDGLRRRIEQLRDNRKLYIYGHLVDCTMANGCGASGRPLLGLDGSYPRAFLNAANQADISLQSSAEAYGRLAMFLVAHYQADFFTPWRELNRLAVFGNRDLSPRFAPAYKQIVSAVNGYDSTVPVFVSWHLESLFQCEDELNEVQCGLSRFAGGRAHTAQIAEFWKLNRDNPGGKQPTLLAFSTYPVSPVELVIKPTSQFTPNLKTALESAGFYLQAYKSAFQSTGLAISETGYRGWGCLEFDDPYLASEDIYRRYEDEQAIFLNYLVNYQYAADAPWIHPMVFINNWWLADIVVPVEKTTEYPLGPVTATDIDEVDRWMITQSGLFTALVAGRTPKAAYSVIANTFDRDRDMDGVENIRFSSPSKISVRDNCPLTPNPLQIDSDADGRGDACDNCPFVSNFEQWDFNLNGIGNACDPDTAPVLPAFPHR